MADQMSITAAKGPPPPHANQQVQHAQTAHAARQRADAPGARNGEASGANGSNKTQDGPLARILSDALSGAAKSKQEGPAAQEGPKRPERPPAEAIAAVKDYLGGLPSELRFDYDEEAERQVFRIVDPATREVVKQYPPDEFLAMIKRLKELDRNADNNGMLFDDRS
jgi:uncharacterized FlaG/YvyC family protein